MAAVPVLLDVDRGRGQSWDQEPAGWQEWHLPDSSPLHPRTLVRRSVWGTQTETSMIRRGCGWWAGGWVVVWVVPSACPQFVDGSWPKGRRCVGGAAAMPILILDQACTGTPRYRRSQGTCVRTSRLSPLETSRAPSALARHPEGPGLGGRMVGPAHPPTNIQARSNPMALAVVCVCRLWTDRDRRKDRRLLVLDRGSLPQRILGLVGQTQALLVSVQPVLGLVALKPAARGRFLESLPLSLGSSSTGNLIIRDLRCHPPLPGTVH